MTEDVREEILKDIRDGYIDAWSNLTIEELFEQIEKEHTEIQAYRAIGTVKELQSMKEHGAFTGTELAQIAVCQMELQKYMAIGTIEEFKALKGVRNNE